MRHCYPLLVLLVRASAAQDLAAIERLHLKDAAAAKAGDTATLATLWTDDAVALPPGERPVIGIAAIREWLNRGQPGAGKFEITEYRIDFQDIHVMGPETVEWGRTFIAMKPKGASRGMSVSGNILRLLRKRPDGNWKVARAIWNLDPPMTDPPQTPTQATAAAGGLNALDAYRGVWRSKGVSHDTPFSKQGNNSGETSCTWSPNHAFLLCDQTVHPADGSVGHDLSIYTYDEKDRSYQFFGISQGSARVRTPKLSIDGSRWTYSGQFENGGKQVQFRTVNDFVSADKVTYRTEYSDDDGKHWNPMSEGASERAK